MKTRLAGLGLVLALVALAPDEVRVAEVGKAYRVPYRLTLTNHYLVRVRIDGKGPFNFLVDTGAPALYIGTEAAKKVGLEPARNSYWTDVARFDIEGGATLSHVKARIEDPFQLTGMNALGLPGASIDGILGFTILAKFRIQFDPREDRMTWTRLDYDPKEPFVPGGAEKMMPAEMQMMNMLGGVAKVASLFLGKQPEDQLHPRGFLGLELAGADGKVTVASVVAGSPASEAGVKAGDRLVRLLGRDVTDLASAHQAVAEVKPGDRVALAVRRGPGVVDLTAVAGEGL